MSKLPDHHYVPQGYLKGFMNGDGLYVVDKKHNSIRLTAPAGVAYVPGYYIVDTVSEKDSSDVENSFSKIETKCVPIIKKVAAGEYLTNSNIADLAIYIALQYGRTPFSRARMDDITTIVMTNLMKEQLAEMYNSATKYQEMAEHFHTKVTNLEMPSRETIRDWVLKPGPIAKVEVDNGTYVKQFFESAEAIAAELLKRRWIVLRAPRGVSFITSDNPIGLHLNRPLKMGEILAILLEGIQRYFPLDAKTCLVIVDNNQFELNKGFATRGQVKDINRLIYDQSYRYAISGNRNLLLSLKARHDR